MNTRAKRIGVALWMVAVVSASSAFAHDGHGDPTWNGTVMHHLVEPEHLSVILAVVVVVLLAARRRSRSRS